MNDPIRNMADLAMICRSHETRGRVFETIRGNPTAALDNLLDLKRGVDATIDAIQCQQACDHIELALSPLLAAEWFIENVPLDASWRSDAYFALRERMKG